MLQFNRYTYLTFDCYGTLIDWETGIVNAMRPILEGHSVEQTDTQILDLFAELESSIQQITYRSYRSVLAAVVDGFGERHGFVASDDERDTFSGSVVDWPAFPDSVPALDALAQHYKLVILSNVDDDLFRGSAERLQVAFADVITAEQVGSYKPDLRNFEVLVERLNVPTSAILHVAQSLFHDIAPASAAGLDTIWINRRHDKEGFGATPPQVARPDLELPDLESLARVVDDALGTRD